MGWCGLENVSAGCANDFGQPHSKEVNNREAPNDEQT